MYGSSDKANEGPTGERHHNVNRCCDPHRPRQHEEDVTETELARHVVMELQRQGYEMYEEVAVGSFNRRADLVGRRGSVLVVVECKVRMSLHLLDQVVSWRGFANLVIGAYNLGRCGPVVKEICRALGIGLWHVGSSGCDERVRPHLIRRVQDGLRRSLRPQQQSGEYAAAGSPGGGYWTPFRSTAHSLTTLVHAEPGITLGDAMRRIDHHYNTMASAKSALPALIRRGVIDGVRVTDGRPLRLYPSEETKPCSQA